MIRRAIWLAAMVFIWTMPARADYEAGQRAWEAGRADEALAQWQVAAHAGDRRAMRALGQMHLQGLGVLQDYIEAHKWLNLAASRGEATAAQERDSLAEKMTPEQIATAQERAAAWQPDRNRTDAATTAAPTATPATTPSPAPPAPLASQSAAAPTPVPEAPPAAQSAAAPTPVPDVPPAPPHAIREAQSLLAELGYRPGPADGLWGDGTETAYLAFLDDTDLPAAETLTPQALRAMRTAAKRRSADAGSTDEAPSNASDEDAPQSAAPPPPDLHGAAHP